MEPPIFRLLDGIVGWEVADGTGLEGFDDFATGLALARQTPGAIDPSELLPYLPPARLAPGCGKCALYLVTPAPSRLLQLSCCVPPAPCAEPTACSLGFLPLDCPPFFVDAVAVAARRHFVAVSDGGANEVRIYAASGEELLGVAAIDAPGPLAFLPWGGLLVATGGAQPRLVRLSLDGARVGEWPAPLPAPALAAGGSVDRMAFARDGSLWLVARGADATLTLWHATRTAPVFVQAPARELAAAFAPTAILLATREGFCLRDAPTAPTCCFNWYGRPIGPLTASPPVSRARAGQLLTLSIDSGKPRCRWHRVRLEAIVPAGTSLAVAVATSEDPAPIAQGVPGSEVGWESFPAGVPHPDDWDEAPQGALDYLIRQPPGRYLYLRLRLRGDGAATPIVHRIRLDFPRTTSLEHLPQIYREDPRAEDFTERFLALFDAQIENVDRTLERFPAILDGSSVPPEVLPWLGAFLDLAFEGSWTPARRRALLAAAPELYRRRGTRTGLAAAIREVLGVEPVIQEPASERAWGALSHGTQLGAVRLFSKARARFTLDVSTLGQAPLRSFGDPALDPLTAAAFRLRVLIPSTGAQPTSELRDRLSRLIESQKPAHTVVTTRVGGLGFIVGAQAITGVDTALAPLPAPVLGGPLGNVRLSRATTLWPRRRGTRGQLSVGVSAAVGVHTVTA
jgi:phage tail-like protein